MSVRVEVGADVVDVHVEGIDRLWGLRSRLELPVSRITAARVLPANWARGDLRLRTGGLGIPGFAAVGHFRGSCAKNQWWRVYRADQVLVICLDPQSTFSRVVLELSDPELVAESINAVVAASGT